MPIPTQGLASKRKERIQQRYINTWTIKRVLIENRCGNTQLPEPAFNQLEPACLFWTAITGVVHTAFVLVPVKLLHVRSCSWSY